MSKPLTYVDLFAGCGGLSLGLEKAGFKLALAVEKSDMAAETFYHNFIGRIVDIEKWKKFSSPQTNILEQAKEKLVVKELSNVLECKELLNSLRNQEIDLVAGGPPCQGFSLAGRRNPNDVRNKLPWQFLEFVEAINPKAVVIENVSGMGQNFKKYGKSSPFNDLKIALEQTGRGYKVQPTLLNAMHFGVPQHRPRLMLIALRADISEELGIQTYEQTWKSEFDRIENINFKSRPILAPVATHFGENILTVGDAIADLNNRGYNRKSNMSVFAKNMREDVKWMPARIAKTLAQSSLHNHVLRKHGDLIKTRFRLYQYLRDQGIKVKVLAIPKLDDITENGCRILITEALEVAKFPAKSPDGTIIATNMLELVDLVLQLATKKHSQRPLNWSLPSPTVVSLPDDYVHPSEPRTLTVRELARFQSFPDAFEFRAKETTGSMRRRFEVPQYTQVGNAVPPKMAEAVGLNISKILRAANAFAEQPDKILSNCRKEHK